MFGKKKKIDSRSLAISLRSSIADLKFLISALAIPFVRMKFSEIYCLNNEDRKSRIEEIKSLIRIKESLSGLLNHVICSIFSTNEFIFSVFAEKICLKSKNRKHTFNFSPRHPVYPINPA